MEQIFDKNIKYAYKSVSIYESNGRTENSSQLDEPVPGCKYTTVRDGALSFPNLDVEKKCSRTSALMHMESKVFPLLHDMKVLFMVLPIPCEKKTDFPEEKAEMDMPFTVKMLLELRYHLELVVSEYSPSGFHVDLNDYLDVEKKYSRTSALMESPLLHVMKVLFMDLPIPCKKKTDFPEEKVEMDMPFTVKMLLELCYQQLLLGKMAGKAKMMKYLPRASLTREEPHEESTDMYSTEFSDSSDNHIDEMEPRHKSASDVNEPQRIGDADKRKPQHNSVRSRTFPAHRAQSQCTDWSLVDEESRDDSNETGYTDEEESNVDDKSDEGYRSIEFSKIRSKKYNVAQVLRHEQFSNGAENSPAIQSGFETDDTDKSDKDYCPLWQTRKGFKQTSIHRRIRKIKAKQIWVSKLSSSESSSGTEADDLQG